MGVSRPSPAACAHPLSAGTSEAPSRGPPQPLTPPCAVPEARPNSFRLPAPSSQRLKSQQVLRNAEAVMLILCSPNVRLLQSASAALRQRRSLRFPCLRAGRVSRQAVFKSDSAGLEWDVGFSTFALLRSRCSELCGSFWLHTVPGSLTDLSLRFPAVPLCCFCNFLSLFHWTLSHSLPPTSAIFSPPIQTNLYNAKMIAMCDIFLFIYLTLFLMMFT